MKRILLATAFSVTSMSAFAQSGQCNVRIDNELHVKDQVVSVYQNGQQALVIDEDNQVFINGKKLDINKIQQQAVASYREKVSTYVPKAKELAEQGLSLTNDILDDVSEAFDNPSAFDNVKQAIGDFYQGMEARYYKDGEWVIEKDAVQQAISNWKTDSKVAVERLNGEFFSSAFVALSDQMKEDGSINLTELQQQLIELKSTISTRLDQQSETLKDDAKNYCEDLMELAEDEKSLHQSVPELKEYDVFVI